MLHTSDFGSSFKQIQEKLILKNANTNIILKNIQFSLRQRLLANSTVKTLND